MRKRLINFQAMKIDYSLSKQQTPVPSLQRGGEEVHA